MRGNPRAGAIYGLIFGIFFAVDLHMWKLWSLGTGSEILVPLGGVVLGLLLGRFAPFGRRELRKAQAAEAAAEAGLADGADNAEPVDEVATEDEAPAE